MNHGPRTEIGMEPCACAQALVPNPAEGAPPALVPNPADGAPPALVPNPADGAPQA